MTRLTIPKWKGWDSWNAPAALEDTKLAKALNVDLTERGYLKKRGGAVNLGSIAAGAATYLLGRHTSTSADKLLYLTPSNNTLYTANPDGSSPTSLGSNLAYAGIEWMSNYNNMSWMIRSGTSNQIIGFNGSTTTTYSYSATGSRVINGTFITHFKDRAWIINSNQNWDTLLYSIVQPGPASAATAYDNAIDIGLGDGDWLVTCIPFQDQLYIFKSHSTWVLYVDGTPDQWVLKQINPTLGCISRGAALVMDNLLYFLAHDGVYRTDGTTFQEVSAPIRDKFNQNPVSRTSTTFYNYLAPLDDRVVVIMYTGVSPNSVYVYNTKVNGWTEYSFGSAEMVVNGIANLPDKSPASLYFGSRNATGRIFTLGNANLYADQVAGVNNYYQMLVKSKIYDMGESGLWKRMLTSGVDYNGSGFTFTWYSDVGGGVVVQSVPIPAIQSNQGYRTFYPVPPAGWFRTIAFEINHVGSASNQFLEVYGLDMDIKEEHTANAKRNA